MWGNGKPRTKERSLLSWRATNEREGCGNVLRGGYSVPITSSVLDYQDVAIPEDSVIYCFDKDTEILTADGWKNVGEVKMGELCLSREPNTGKLEYVDVVRLISYHHKGGMYKYVGKNVDLCVTPNHRLFVNASHGRSKLRLDEFHAAFEIFNVTSDNRFISAGGKWLGDDTKMVDICGKSFDKGDFAYLLGVFLADGSVNIQGIITISQHKTKIINKILDILQKLGIEHSVYDIKRSNYAKCFYISRKYLPFFKQFYIKENRRIPKEIKNWDKQYLNRLLEGLLDGDGDGSIERRRIICGAKGLIDDIQEICYKVGLSANVRKRKPHKSFLKSENRWINATKPVYILSINHKPYLSIRKDNQKIIDYDDVVNCVTLSKWHTVLVRRNGKPIWCGQCDIPYEGTNVYNKAEVFDYERFYDWCGRQVEPVFISSYQMPEDRFDCIEEFVHRSTLCATANNQVTERIFVPKHQSERGNKRVQLSLF